MDHRPPPLPQRRAGGGGGAGACHGACQRDTAGRSSETVCCVPNDPPPAAARADGGWPPAAAGDPRDAVGHRPWPLADCRAHRRPRPAQGPAVGRGDPRAPTAHDLPLDARPDPIPDPTPRDQCPTPKNVCGWATGYPHARRGRVVAALRARAAVILVALVPDPSETSAVRAALRDRESGPALEL